MNTALPNTTSYALVWLEGGRVRIETRLYSGENKDMADALRRAANMLDPTVKEAKP